MKKVSDILEDNANLREAWLRDCEHLSLKILNVMALEKASFLTKWAQEEIDRRRESDGK